MAILKNTKGFRLLKTNFDGNLEDLRKEIYQELMESINDI